MYGIRIKVIYGRLYAIDDLVNDWIASNEDSKEIQEIRLSPLVQPDAELDDYEYNSCHVVIFYKNK